MSEKNPTPFQEEQVREALEKFLGNDYNKSIGVIHSKRNGNWIYLLNNRKHLRLHDSFVPQFARIDILENNKIKSYKTYDFQRKIIF